MTWIHRADIDPVERAKWRENADKASTHMKALKFDDKAIYEILFAFDDSTVRMHIEVDLIKKLDEKALADWVFDAVLAKCAAHRAAGDSAEAFASASGMECGHAAAQAPAVTGNDPRPTSSSSGPDQPAAAAVVERCWRRIPPAYTEQCEHNATGGIRLVCYAAEHLQKRYGRKPLLKLILDLPVCSSCFALMTPMQVIVDGLQPGQWADISRTSQKRNHGVLPIKEQSTIEHVPFTDHEYAALRVHIAKEHPDAKRATPEVPQPAPAAPQPEGAG